MEDPINPAFPLATFFRLIPTARLPQRADRSAAGTLPTRAFRFCEALTSASAFGWYLFPPIGFTLMWDGTDVVWTYDGAEDWYPLQAAQFPDFADYFDNTAPKDIQGFSPPFLASLIEPGIVQIWSGMFARTAPGWSLLIRAPANFVRNPGYECYEGIIETDQWFGPLFTNVRLTRTHHPIVFDANIPFLQLQPVQQQTYGSGLDDFKVIENLESFNDADWNAYRRTVMKPGADSPRKRGQYAVASRRRQKQSQNPSSTTTTESD
jgi:hypothetical protein